MTLYLVKHESNSYRLHKPDGTEIGTWTAHPSQADMATAVSKYHGSPSKGKGGPREFIRDDTKIAAGDFVYRDLTISDETVPW